MHLSLSSCLHRTSAVAINLAVALALFTSPASRGAVITVDTFLDEYDTDTASDAGCSLREAVQAANSDSPFGSCDAGSGDDEVLLPIEIDGVPGTYALTRSARGTSNTGALAIFAPLTFTGTGGTAVIDGAALNDNILDVGLGAGRVELRNLELTGGTEGSTGGGAITTRSQATLVLTDVILRDNSSIFDGGAILVRERGEPYADPVLDFERVVFEGNVAEEDGGAVKFEAPAHSFVLNSSCTGCFFVSNSARVGGAVDVRGAHEITFRESTFTANLGVSGGGGGGAISAALDAVVTLENVTMQGNVDDSIDARSHGYRGTPNSSVVVNGGTFSDSFSLAETASLEATGARWELNDGPAIYADGGTVQLTDTVVDSNLCTGCDLFAVELDATTATINGSVFSSNQGALDCLNCNLTVRNSSFADNSRTSVGGDGAALRVQGVSASATIENSTFSGNTSLTSGILAYGSGAAVLLVDGVSFEFNNVTITDNRGGGLDSASAGVEPQISNSLLAGNIAGSIFNSPSLDCVGLVDSLDWNLVGVDSMANPCFVTPALEDQVGSAASPIDALIGPLYLVDGMPIHGLLPGSPARDAGNPAEPGEPGPSCEGTDQIGQARPVDGGAAMRCDIGAIEETGDGTEPTMFDDGFETGDLSGWSSSTP